MNKAQIIENINLNNIYFIFYCLELLCNITEKKNEMNEVIDRQIEVGKEVKKIEGIGLWIGNDQYEGHFKPAMDILIYYQEFKMVSTKQLEFVKKILFRYRKQLLYFLNLNDYSLDYIEQITKDYHSEMDNKNFEIYGDKIHKIK